MLSAVQDCTIVVKVESAELSLDGLCACQLKVGTKTEQTDFRGTSQPRWDQVFEMPVADLHSSLELTLTHKPKEALATGEEAKRVARTEIQIITLSFNQASQRTLSLFLIDPSFTSASLSIVIKLKTPLSTSPPASSRPALIADCPTSPSSSSQTSSSSVSPLKENEDVSVLFLRSRVRQLEEEINAKTSSFNQRETLWRQKCSKLKTRIRELENQNFLLSSLSSSSSSTTSSSSSNPFASYSYNPSPSLSSLSPPTGSSSSSTGSKKNRSQNTSPQDPLFSLKNEGKRDSGPRKRTREEAELVNRVLGDVKSPSRGLSVVDISEDPEDDEKEKLKKDDHEDCVAKIEAGDDLIEPKWSQGDATPSPPHPISSAPLRDPDRTPPGFWQINF